MEPPSNAIAVVYDPPGMGQSRVPNPISGDGTLAVTDDGIAVEGNKSHDVSFLALLAFLASLALGIYFDLGTNITVVIALTAIGIVAATRLRSKKRIQVHYPWSAIRKMRYDTKRGALVLLIKGAKPKGELFIRQPADSPLQRDLAARLAAKS